LHEQAFIGKLGFTVADAAALTDVESFFHILMLLCDALRIS
ncbi:MAG: hypothetical protein JWO80_4244, partial [Bryobacterales bacterium]|nr:hypothetical protein [Bryobacterales bacterium]